MIVISYVYTFILGICLGSFYNIVGLRIPKKESIVFPPSHCTQCQQKLSPAELIPVFSYLFLRGKCKSCQNKISCLYPISELMTGMFFVYALWRTGWSGELAVAWSLISLLVIITVSDLRYKIISNKVLTFFFILFIMIRLFLPLDPWWDSIAGPAVGFFLPFIIAHITKGGMGGGDIKLFGVLGLVLGWKGILLCFFLSSFYGAMAGTVGLLLGKFERKQAIPFGPFIALGALTSYFAAEELLDFYKLIFLI